MQLCTDLADDGPTVASALATAASTAALSTSCSVLLHGPSVISSVTAVPSEVVSAIDLRRPTSMRVWPVFIIVYKVAVAIFCCPAK